MLNVLYGFRETPEFTKKLFKHLTDDEYAELQWFLLEQPDSGDLIVGGSGVRKVRWKAKGRGKSGGVRVIYYLATAAGKILLLNIYGKNDQTDLTQEQLERARASVEQWKDEQKKL